MKSTLRSSLAVAALACVAAISLSAAEPAAVETTADGYVDFGQLVPADTGKFVEVNLPTGLLKFAAACVSKQEPQASELIGSLRHVRVNVVELNDANRAQTLERVRAVRRQLAAAGWTTLASVREQADGNDVQIFARMRGETAIAGLAVTVIGEDHEVVLVNIVGDITAEQIATLADRLHIDPLKHVQLPKPEHT